MNVPPRPHWVDQLLEKHECFGYDNPSTIEMQHAGEMIKVLVPRYLTDVQALATSSTGSLLFILGKQSEKYRDEHLGVVLIAKHKDGNTYEVGVWHELFPRALWHLGVVEAVHKS